LQKIIRAPPRPSGRAIRCKSSPSAHASLRCGLSASITGAGFSFIFTINFYNLMRFISWLKEQTKRADQVGAFAKWATSNKKFPLSSDPEILSVFLRLQELKGELYAGFQMSYVEYSLTEKNQVPKDFQNLDALKKALL
jgi:hypothetical protein